MNRVVLSLVALLGALAPFILDSALKGAALLALAALCALLLIRASAATRHLVWLVAVVALLIVPLLSVALPQWRVLPAWKSVASEAAQERPYATYQTHRPYEAASPPKAPLPTGPAANPALPVAPAVAAVAAPAPLAPTPLAWSDWLPTAWMLGFVLLAARLLAAHLLLRRAARRCTRPAPHDALAEALATCRAELGIRQRVTLLLDAKRTIPIVWGVFRPRLLLPAEASAWTNERRRAVLLHELAHVKRRDTLVQWLAQIACALHWWNPLVWLAAWRLHVERERACDDLVLASGVRPSDYAEHLLHVATRLSPARGTQGCGLAMARKSSLEGRLMAVLSEKLNRRGVSRALAGLALLSGAAVAIPLAMLRAEVETPSKETVAKEPLKPWAYRDMDTALLRRWQQLEGEGQPIPESRVAGLRSAIGRFVDGIDASPFFLTPEQIAELKALQTQGADQEQHTAEAAEKFVKAVFALHGEPIQMAFNESPWPGTPWNVEDLEKLPFGPPAPNGLRVALRCDKDRFIFGDTARLDLQLWNSGNETLLIGIGREGPGLYPDLNLHAVGQGNREIPTTTSPETKMLAEITFTKLWQLRPGESADVYGYTLRVGPGASRAHGFVPEWHTYKEMPDVRSGEGVTLTATLPYPSAPGAPSEGVTLETGAIAFRAVAPEEVLVWSAPGAGTWPMPDGVTLEVKLENYHAADVLTSAVLTWPKDAAGLTYAYTIGLGADAFANRDPWHLVWEKDATVLWAMSGQMQSWPERKNTLATPHSVRRIDFADRMRITTTTWSHQPEAMPEGIRTEFLTAFKPLPAEPRNPGEAKGHVQVAEAHDVRPIAELLRGVWKNKEGHIDVRVTFPESDTGKIGWALDFKHQVGVSVVTASLSRILNPAENAVGLFVAADPAGLVHDDDILGRLRRGPNNTLLLDITPKPKYPDYDAAQGLVLVRDDGKAQVDPPATKPENGAARMLFAQWQKNSTEDGLIPGTALAPLVRTAEGFLKREPGSERSRKLISVLNRIDMTRTWKPDEVAALLDEVADIFDQLLDWASLSVAPEAEDWAQRFREIGAWDYNPGELFDPEELSQLATQASSLAYPESRRLSHLINRAGAEKATRFRYLLTDAETEKFRDLSKFPVESNDFVEATAIAMALAGYDYSVNGNQAALQSILNYLAAERPGSDAAGIAPLAFIDEWDLTITAFRKHFAAGTDGAGGISHGLFWMTRECLFPQSYQRFQPWRDGHAGIGEIIPEIQVAIEPAPTAGNERPPDGKVDWDKLPNNSLLSIPFDPEAGIRLAAAPNKSDEDIRRLMMLILQGAAEKSPALLPLLNDEELKRHDDEHHSLALALSAYDFSVNGKREALQYIFDALAKERPGSDAHAAVPLAFIDEWDLTMTAHEKHYAKETDGAGGDAHWLFWERRKFLFPENFARFQKDRLAAAKLDDASLRGVWKGSKDGVVAEVRFGENQGWEVKFGEKRLVAELKTHASETGKVVMLMAPRAPTGWVPCGRLRRGDDGTLRLNVWPDTSETSPYPRVSDLVLTKSDDAPVPQESPKPKPGAKLDPKLEQQLEWGEPVDGLRAALWIRPSTDDPKAGGTPDLFVAVQNVSERPVRFDDSQTEEKSRTLYLKLDGETQMGMGAKEPAFGAITLQPREFVMAPMYALEPIAEGGQSTGALLAAGLLKDTRQSATVHLLIDNAPAGAWTGKLLTTEINGAAATGAPQPKGEEAQSLFRIWRARARADGKIPGGMLKPLVRVMENFTKNNPTEAATPKFVDLLKRIDTSRNWSPEEAVALLDEVTAAYPNLPQWVEEEDRFTLHREIQSGQPLPADLVNAPWGETQANGLRTAWLLEPRAERYPVGTRLTSRLLIHNTGKETVVFVANSFNQAGGKAQDAEGGEIDVSSIYWTTLGQMTVFRLAPGEFCEVWAPGFGIGTPSPDDEDWANVRVGARVDAKAGDAVTLTPSPLSLNGIRGGEGAEGDPDWWRDFIMSRIDLETPLPTAAADREATLRRLVRELYGSGPSPEEIAAYAADESPAAQHPIAGKELLRTRVQHGRNVSAFTGELQGGVIDFRVVAVDPDAATKPRTASGPGNRTLGDKARLVIVQKPVDDRRVNEAHLEFPAADPHAIKLPDGNDNYTVAWEPGTTMLWVAEPGTLRGIDFTDPTQIHETRLDLQSLSNFTEALREALRPTLEASPAPPAASTP